ncbi:ABC transporter substrate-binding protein [Brevibacillus fluminis]|uniref:ABC transporter substrate-binding protein n=1 Tax=Brevibacillus fluminis TaxID=511487 RepID=A0A3M8DA54_9BACL|nr:ABC transporter substrate-binding protein [Brevibacillus fluminis]RNB84848.1 ABC transporter substrate-binding protein [Brevibacillus fluminis]
MKTVRGKRGIISVLLIMICLSLVGGCSSQSGTPVPDQQTDSVKPQSGGTITVASFIDPDTLDPHKSVGTDQLVTWQMGGSLLYKDPVTKEFKPYLANHYTISEDGKTMTFTIRKGVSFQDGTPLTAKSFKDTYDRILNPRTNAKQVRTFLEPVKSVKAPDNDTLILELNEPSASILDFLSTGSSQPLSMKAIEKYGDDYGRNPVGVGPWKFESWKPGEGVTLVRNEAFHWAEPFYKNQGPPKLDKLVVKTISDSSVMMSALDNGSIDVAMYVPARNIKKYRNNPKYQVLERYRPGLSFTLRMNLSKPEFQDVQVRKAFNMLINKEAIIQAALMGEGKVAQTIIGPGMLGYDKSLGTYGYQYDVDEAKKLLDAAGWKVNGSGLREKDGKTLTLAFLSTPTYDKEAQLVQAMLGEVGIKSNIQNLEAGTYINEAVKGNFDLTFGTATFEDPSIMYMSFHSNQIGAYNYASVKDEIVDALLEKGQTAFDMEVRKMAYEEAQKRMMEQAYLIPIYNDKLFTVVNSRVKGVTWTSYVPMFNDSWVQK